MIKSQRVTGPGHIVVTFKKPVRIVILDEENYARLTSDQEFDSVFDREISHYPRRIDYPAGDWTIAYDDGEGFGSITAGSPVTAVSDAPQKEEPQKGSSPATPLTTMPRTRRWTSLLTQARQALQTTIQEMQGYYDGRPEEWRNSENAQAMQGRIQALKSILSELNGIRDG